MYLSAAASGVLTEDWKFDSWENCGGSPASYQSFLYAPGGEVQSRCLTGEEGWSTVERMTCESELNGRDGRDLRTKETAQRGSQTLGSNYGMYWEYRMPIRSDGGLRYVRMY
jgi:hypothetical protein